MKISIAGLTLIILSMLCLISIAIFGIEAIGLPGVFDSDGIRLGLDLAGGSTIVYEPDTGENPTEEEFNTAIVMIRNRLDLLNYSEATVTASGAKAIRVEIPGISNPEEAVQKLGASAVLEFRNADGDIVLEGKDIKSAAGVKGDPLGKGYEEYFVNLEFNDAAVEKFALATRDAASRPSGENYIAIYLDDVLQSSPSVESEINDNSCVITGSFTKEEVIYLGGVISAGNLPFALKDVQLSSTGPVLGEKALQTSLIAGAIGIALVMVYMIVFYKILGFISSIALVIYVALIGVVLVITQANLSLPGIAGIVLSIGMAVDANVIIFERIREELHAGKSLKASVSSGFNRAFTAIIDSNITTAIAAIVLWIFGSGPISGFATTLFMGIVISMFTAITVTRMLINRFVEINNKNIKIYGA